MSKAAPLHPPLRSAVRAPTPGRPASLFSEILSCLGDGPNSEACHKLRELDGLAADALRVKSPKGLFREILTHDFHLYADRHPGARQVCERWWRGLTPQKRQRIDRLARKHPDVTDFYLAKGILPPGDDFTPLDLATDTRRVLVRLVPSTNALLGAAQAPESARKQFIDEHLDTLGDFLRQSLRVSHTKPSTADARNVEIMEHWRAGESSTTIADRLGMNYPTVNQVVSRQSRHSRWPLRVAVHQELSKLVTPGRARG